VEAYEANGRYLGAPEVTAFIDTGNQQNLAAKFHDGAATGIPYGVYRIEGRQPWHYTAERYVRIYQPSAAVTLGLRFAAELPETPPTLPGRIIGLAAPAGRGFVKLVGIYEDVSVESAIDSGGNFTLGGLSPGAFLLLVVGEKGILASRSLTIPYSGPPIEIEIGRDHAIANP
jgi:hypothetical protein